MALKNVLAPIKIGSCTIPNRVVFAAHGTNFGRGSVSDKLIAHHGTAKEVAADILKGR